MKTHLEFRQLNNKTLACPIKYYNKFTKERPSASSPELTLPHLIINFNIKGFSASLLITYSYSYSDTDLEYELCWP